MKLFGRFHEMSLNQVCLYRTPEEKIKEIINAIVNLLSYRLGHWVLSPPHLLTQWLFLFSPS